MQQPQPIRDSPERFRGSGGHAHWPRYKTRTVGGLQRVRLEEYMKANLIFLSLIALSLVAIGLPRHGLAQGLDVRQKWERDSASGAVFFTVGNARMLWDAWHYRQITVFVNPQEFTIENIKAIFLHLSEKYPSEDLLLIDALSNDEQLDEKVRWFAEIQSFPFGNVPPPPSTDGSKPARLFAGYSRSDGSEGFNYYPATGESVPMFLKSPSRDCAPSGDTAVDLVDASMRGCKAAVEHLLDAGADPNAKSRHGGVALVEASYRGEADIVKLLLEVGADINQTSASGWSPLIAAVSGNRSRSIELLLSRGADVNVKSEDGRTALILAVLRQNLGVVKELLARGADVNVKDGYGKTALGIAEEEQNEDLVRLLKRAGASR